MFVVRIIVCIPIDTSNKPPFFDSSLSGIRVLLTPFKKRTAIKITQEIYKSLIQCALERIRLKLINPIS